MTIFIKFVSTNPNPKVSTHTMNMLSPADIAAINFVLLS